MGQASAFLGCWPAIRSLQTFHRSAAHGDKRRGFISCFLYPIPAITAPFIPRLATVILSPNSRLIPPPRQFLPDAFCTFAKYNCPSRGCLPCLVSNDVSSFSLEFGVGRCQNGPSISPFFSWVFPSKSRVRACV